MTPILQEDLATSSSLEKQVLGALELGFEAPPSKWEEDLGRWRQGGSTS